MNPQILTRWKHRCGRNSGSGWRSTPLPKNIMAYLRTTILNAPTTMEHYYQAQGNWLTAQNRKK